MERLTNRVYLEAVLSRFHFRFRKKYGQNFLTNAAVVDGICDAADVGPEDVVLEIGPGIGTMTQILATRAGKVVAVEIDPELIPVLEDTLFGQKNIRIINDDIMKVDIAGLAAEENSGKPLKVVANLPYYITTPILMKLLAGRAPISSITVMVQREVAQRMQAGPGSKDYGALSLAVQYYTEPVYIMDVPAGDFMPRPKVDSAVIRLDVRQEPAVRTRDETLLFDVIRGAFQQRRKTLVNALSNAPKIHISKEELTACIQDAGLDPQIRGEKLALSDFSRLADRIADARDGQN